MIKQLMMAQIPLNKKSNKKKVLLKIKNRQSSPSSQILKELEMRAKVVLLLKKILMRMEISLKEGGQEKVMKMTKISKRKNKSQSLIQV